MQKGIFLISDVNESGVQPRHQFFDFGQVDIADGIADASRLPLEGDESRVFKQSY